MVQFIHNKKNKLFLPLLHKKASEIPCRSHPPHNNKLLYFLFENNLRSVYHICVANPLAKELSNCLLYPPSLTTPEACINVKDVTAVLLTRNAAFTAHLLQSSYLGNAAGSRLITNLTPEARNRLHCFLHTEDYSSNVKDTNKEEEENDEEEEEGEDNEEDRFPNVPVP